MTEALWRYHAGTNVKMTCYQEGCEGVSIPVVLGKKDHIHPMFTGNGRFRWTPDRSVKSFKLPKHYRCPKCNTLFASVIIVSIGCGGKPVIFGYNPEPA